MRIAWICHFTNEQIQSILKPHKKVSEFAPWITYTIAVFENRYDIELHIISPHEYISGIKEFKLNGIYYHFFNPYIPIWGRHWPSFFKWDYWTDFKKNKRIVKRLVEKINPDIIHLQGAENPYYSSTILQFFGNLPVIVNLQKTSFDMSYGDSIYAKTRQRIEKEIISKSSYLSVQTKSMFEDITELNPLAKIYYVSFSELHLNPIDIEKKYDIVFFARVCPEKGIIDLLKALQLVKKSISNVSLYVIGPCAKNFLEEIKKISKELEIENNIVWKGYLSTLKDVYLEASKAKISVLPTYYDIIPGTIIESMQLGLPVVSYKTGSIPELNEERENVLLVDKGNIEGLANNIINLLTDKELYKTMRERGIEYTKKIDNNDLVFHQHLECYQKVIEDFYNNKEGY